MAQRGAAGSCRCQAPGIWYKKGTGVATAADAQSTNLGVCFRIARIKTSSHLGTWWARGFRPSRGGTTTVVVPVLQLYHMPRREL